MELACALKEPSVINVISVTSDTQVQLCVALINLNSHAAGEIPNCQRCPECLDNGLQRLNELAARITVIVMRLDQLISARAPLDNISDIISELNYQLVQAQSAVQNMLITTSNVTSLENKANNVS